jgi:hypothetical protein
MRDRQKMSWRIVNQMVTVAAVAFGATEQAAPARVTINGPEGLRGQTLGR